MVAPVHGGEVDYDDEEAFICGWADWDNAAEWVLITVTGPGISVYDFVWWPGGKYFISVDHPEEGDIFTVTASLEGTGPEIVRTDIEYRDDFHQIFPQRYWVHIENFLW
jgi:hypothetical protein